MAISQTDHLVILAGGQSRRMGRDKAIVNVHDKRMIDHMIDRYRSSGCTIILSATQDYGTGFDHVPDHPGTPPGPIGAILSLSSHFLQCDPPVYGFYTVPVDAPYAPLNVIEKLKVAKSCAIASSNHQLHPVFAYWQCETVLSVKQSILAEDDAPSLKWLARQCHAKIVEWEDGQGFSNINTPEELKSLHDRD